MKIRLKPLYMRLNSGVGDCKLGCTEQCQVHQAAPGLKLPENHTCPLYQHQVDTYHEVTEGNADVIFVEVATGGGKSLGAALPSLMDRRFGYMGLYPTIELGADQYRQQKLYHTKLFTYTEAQFNKRVDQIYGSEISRRVNENTTNRSVELRTAIHRNKVVLTNPDLFHYMTHFQYSKSDQARSADILPITLANQLRLWVFDEFHIFGPHQEAAALNSMLLIRGLSHRKRTFLFTSATPKSAFKKNLQSAGFEVEKIQSAYASGEVDKTCESILRASDGSDEVYKCILQTVDLEFVYLNEQTTFEWLLNNLEKIQDSLTKYPEEKVWRRGLVILNSVMLAGRVTAELTQQLQDTDILVLEISGRIDPQTREEHRQKLENAKQPVLVIATSAVDIGVDFNINLLIFESSNSATVTQRLGRLGRHEGYKQYEAFLLIPKSVNWIYRELETKLEEGQVLDRITELKPLIEEIFRTPQEFEIYQDYWGAAQAQGMLSRIEQATIDKYSKTDTTKDIRADMTASLSQVYNPKRFDFWYVHKSRIKDELLRFRGSSSLQVAVQDGNQFYTTDLLRLLPYVTVSILTRKQFLSAALFHGRNEEDFNDRYLCAYLQVQEILTERQQLNLLCNKETDDSAIEVCTLTTLDELFIEGHCQASVRRLIPEDEEQLTYLIPFGGKFTNLWSIRRKLYLESLFGLYLLHDSAGQKYACALNQDALMLAALCSERNGNPFQDNCQSHKDLFCY